MQINKANLFVWSIAVPVVIAVWSVCALLVVMAVKAMLLPMR